MSKMIFKPRVRPVATAIALAAATALGGCMTDADFNEVATPYAPITPEKRYPISVSESAVSIDVPVHKKMSRLSGDVRADVQRFVGQYRARGTGRLKVVSPRKARYRTSLAVAVSEIRSIINAAGIHPQCRGLDPLPQRGCRHHGADLHVIRDPGRHTAGVRSLVSEPGGHL